MLAICSSRSRCSFEDAGRAAAPSAATDFSRWSSLLLQVVEVLFLDRQRVELAVERVLALGEPRFVLFELAAGGFVLPLELLLELELLLPGGQLDFLGLVLRLLEGVLPELVRFGAGAGEGVLAGHLEVNHDRAGAGRQPDHQADEEVKSWVRSPTVTRQCGFRGRPD